MSYKLINLLIIQNLLKYSVCDYLYPAIQTTTSLPEIIINKNALVPPTSSYSNSGYYYPVPQPPNNILPPLQDEIPNIPTDSGYVPPQNDYLPPVNDFQPVIPSPHPVYGVPTVPILQKQNGNFDNFGVSGSTIAPSRNTNIRVISMSCLDSTDSRFFRAVIQSTDFAQTSPIFTKTIFGCNIVRKLGHTDVYVVNLEGIAVGNCGVRYCANRKLCLNLRLPTVQGLQLPEDRYITLQCAPQHSIASVVRSLGIKTQKIQSRSLGFNTVATGGNQRVFRPHLALYRKGNQLVEPGSSVFLGEDLILKATITEGDDWKFSRIGSVVMQQGIQSQGERKSVTLVDNDGCRVETMKSVCPNHPEQLGNKITVLPFRAFLFQDVDGDEMLLSVRLFGCMHQKDCQQTKHCEEKVTAASSNLNLGRRKRTIDGELNSNRTYESAVGYYADNVVVARAVDGHNGHIGHDSHNGQRRDNTIDGGNDVLQQEVQDYESHLDFRVVLPSTVQRSELNSSYLFDRVSIDDIYNGFLIVSIVLFVGISCIVVLFVLVKALKSSESSKVEDYEPYKFKF